MYDTPYRRGTREGTGYRYLGCMRRMDVGQNRENETFSLGLVDLRSWNSSFIINQSKTRRTRSFQVVGGLEGLRGHYEYMSIIYISKSKLFIIL